jgi:hypothetical protein
MFNPIRSVLPAIAALSVVGVILDTPVAAGSGAGGSGQARAARTLSVHDLAKTHLVNASGDTLIEEGRAFGSLPGSARVTLSFNGSTTTSRFTFHLSGGSISGRGRAKLHSGNGHYESFGGTATIIGGTGRYAHISGNGGFYGVLDRSNSNAEVQVTGNLHM